MKECFIATSTNKDDMVGYPFLLRNEKELKEFLDTSEFLNNKNIELATYTIDYEVPKISKMYLTLRGELVRGDFYPEEENQ